MSDSSERNRSGTGAAPSVDGDRSSAAAGERTGLDRIWYRSRLGVAVIVLDVLLTVALVAAASVAVGAPFVAVDGLASGIVPPSVPLFSLLGALGFVFTALIERFDASVGTLVRYNFRLPAALPLGVGIYLLSDVVLGQGVDDVPLVVGVVFLSGLYVNLAYKRLGALGRRLLPSGRGEGDAERGGN
ncbi:hypothetical protein [Halorubrum sp. 2020YC2]|uniref:hypothetical protein n=1 Tax=Halorubrum sp. 2020YC2 TaxID=2836432 RepID=UPI001BEC6ADC|nr:hypothetical protein [Halorubrum sp. 2020YC2]QWC18697.1 hypothetical protein KI388_11240 [Halorubrum sp. 2020YC2]